MEQEAPSNQVGALMDLLRDFPPEALSPALQVTVARLKGEEREALAPLVHADLDRVLAAVRTLSVVSAQRAHAVMLEVAAQVASGSVTLDPGAVLPPLAPPPSPPSNQHGALIELLRDFPPEALSPALQVTVARLKGEEREALAPLVDAGLERVLAALRSLSVVSAQRVHGVLLEVAAQVASGSVTLDPGAVLPPAAPAPSPPSNQHGALMELLRDFPPETLAPALQVTVMRLKSAERETLAPLVHAGLERVLAAVRTLSVVSAQRVHGVMLEVAAQVASGSVTLEPGSVLPALAPPAPVAAPAEEPEGAGPKGHPGLRRHESGGGMVSLGSMRSVPTTPQVATPPDPPPQVPTPTPQAPKVQAPARPEAPAPAPARTRVSLRDIPRQRLLAGTLLVAATAFIVYQIPFWELAAAIFGESHPEWFGH